MSKIVRVLVIDDSALVRRLTTELLNRTGKIEVVATAADPIAAFPKLSAGNLDVILLDINMPKMDGLQFLREIRHTCSIPVIMVSSFTEAGNENTLRALELGAVDFVTKPKLDVQRGLEELAAEMTNKILAAAARRRPRRPPRLAAATGLPIQPSSPSSAAHSSSPIEVIAIAASTGGTEALRELFAILPEGLPPIVIVQHMPASFTKSFARHLDQIGLIRVKEAADGDMLTPGCAYVAPGNHHLEIQRRKGICCLARLSKAPPVNGHRPSADVLFQSCAEILEAKAIGIILTGMGHDGAKGLLAMREHGALTIAQNEETCLIFGMPKEAIESGAAARILPLLEIPSAVTTG